MIGPFGDLVRLWAALGGSGGGRDVGSGGGGAVCGGCRVGRSLCRDSRGLGGVFGGMLMLVTGRERRRRTGSGLFQTDSGSGFCFGMRFGLCEVCVLAVLITFI